MSLRGGRGDCGLRLGDLSHMIVILWVMAYGCVDPCDQWTKEHLGVVSVLPTRQLPGRGGIVGG